MSLFQNEISLRNNNKLCLRQGRAQKLEKEGVQFPVYKFPLKISV